MSTFATGFEADTTHDFFLLGLAIDNNGNVFVAASDEMDSNLKTTIYEVMPNGTPSPFGWQPVPGCECSVPGEGFGPAFDSADNLFVANSGGPDNSDPSYQAIFKFAPGGGASSLFVQTTDFPEGTGPAGLAFDLSGNFFVSTESAAPPTPYGEILEFTPAGAPYQPIPTGTPGVFATGLAHYPRGIAFDAGGNLFVAETGVPSPGDILEISASGGVA